MNWTALEAWLLARASEKSTWVGIFSLVTSACGWVLAPDMAVQITTAATGIAGALLMAMKEKGSEK